MTSTALHAVVAFVSGAAYETLCVAWFHFAERNRPLPLTGIAMLTATVGLLGVGESLHDWHRAPFYVAGYGVGAFCSLWVKRRVGRAAVGGDDA